VFSHGELAEEVEILVSPRTWLTELLSAGADLENFMTVAQGRGSLVGVVKPINYHHQSPESMKNMEAKFCS